MRHIITSLAIVLTLFVIGCPTAQSAGSAANAPITVTDGANKKVLALAKTSTGFTVTAHGKAVGTLKVKDNKITLIDPKGATVGSLKRDGDELKLNDANGKRVVKLKPKEGGYRLKDGADATLLKIKPKDAGFKLGDENGKSFGKVKPKDGKLKIMSDTDTTLFVIAGPVKPDVAGVLIVKQLTPLQQAAFLAGGGL